MRLLSVLLLLGLGASAVPSAATSVTVSKLDRQVDLTDSGKQLVIASTLEIKDEGALGSFKYCATQIVKDRKLLWIEFGEGDEKLEWTLDDDRCCLISLPERTDSRGSRNVEVYEIREALLVGLQDWYQSDKQLVQLELNVVARDPPNLEILEQTTTIKLPSSNVDHFTEVKPASLKGSELTFGPYDLSTSPTASTVATVVVEHPEPLLEIDSVVRDITVSSWRDIEVQEHYHIKNVGPSFKDGFSRVEYQRNPKRYIANAISMVLPKQAHSLFWIDVLGNITTSRARFESTRVSVEAEPRFPLVPGWQTHFTLGYKLPKGAFLKRDPKTGAKNLVMGVYPAVKGILIRNLTINTAVPEFSTGIKGGVLASNAFFTDGDPFRTVKRDTSTKKWWLDISGRPVRTLEISDVSSELSGLTFYVTYHFNNLLQLKEVFMFAAVWVAVFLVVTLWSYSDFTLVKSKLKRS